VARAIEADTTGLLNEDQWRTILIMVLDSALANPGRLFSSICSLGNGLNCTRNHHQIARCSAGVSERQRCPPSAMSCLARRLAVSSRLRLPPQARCALALAKKEGKLLDRLSQLVELCRRLNKLATETDPEKIISSAGLAWLSLKPTRQAC